MVVLARACYMEANDPDINSSRTVELTNRAVDLYDRILSISKDKKVIEEARNNKQHINDTMRGM
jgi:hypothetical protein